ncbi:MULTISPECIES: AraC family transcriptional regulator [Catenuloplanes]|uniref:AraC-like DNA-binding protein n=1 Tax=Catenuloplanes niger TaxID=587534 RepID=A0AAE3ZKP1_9ACTN|nr:helix-turn-helix transcriptional regulator [Catenuloplanes niger]MDR7321031.1 AraC-like DNA-binding protein [Catenuloplanes niger]
MDTPQRMDVVTHDRDAVADAVNRIIRHRARVSFADADTTDLAVRSVAYRDLSAFRVRLTGVRYGADVPPMPMVTAGVIAGGRARIRIGRQEILLSGGDGVVYPEGVTSGGEYGDTRMMFVQLPLSYVAAVAGEPGLRFESFTPVNPRMRRHWAETADYLVRQITAPALDLPPLLADQLRRLAATSVLTVFPNTAMIAGCRRVPGREPTAVVRRAITFMEQHAADPLTIIDLAAAAGVGPRGLQAAFRRHLDTTPLARLRRIRLERVHQELRSADPAGGVTVRAVAHRWGFANPGRFAGQYRALFGETPAHTLRN